MDSSANILRRPDDGEYGEDKVWRPPLVEVGEGEGSGGGDGGGDDDDEGGLGDVVRGASPSGRGGGGYGFGCDGMAGVLLPTPPESGEDGKVKSSLGHSQSWGRRTSSGHGLDGRALPGGCSGACEENTSAQLYPVYGYLPGPGPAYVPPGGGVGAEAAPGTYYIGMTGEVTHGAPGDVVPSDGGQQQGLGGGIERDRSGEAVTGAGGLVTPRTSEGGDFGRSSDGTICEVAGGAAELERGSGSGSSRASRGTTTVRVDSTSTSSRSRRSLKEVLKRFRPSSKEISPAGPMLGAVAAEGATTTHGGAETRPGYDYGAIVRPHQRQVVLERAFGHHHPQSHLDGAGNGGLGLVPPPPAILVNHAQAVRFPLLDAYPLTTDAPPPTGPTTVLTNGPAYELEHVDSSPHPYELSVDEIENEEDSLDPRSSVVRDKLLDPFFLSPAAAGSSPNIEGASLRDYVDYSRRIGGVSFGFPCVAL